MQPPNRSLFLLALGSALLLLPPPALGAPSSLEPRVHLYENAHDKTVILCSADDDSDDAVVPFANTTAWTRSMTACLGRLNSTNWNGYDCAPADALGSPLGPTFGFWKGETHHAGPQYALDCYTQCSPCLQQGINNHRAVTTSCQFKSYAWQGPAVRWTCDMGFDYGEVQGAANNTVSKG